MNEELAEIALDSRALAFIKESLSDAIGVAKWVTKKEESADGAITTRQVPQDIHKDALAHYLLRRTDLGQGTIVTCAPEDVPQDSLYWFREGGKLKVDPRAVEYRDKGQGVLRSVPPEFFGEGVTRVRAVPVPNTNEWLVAIVQEYLRGGSDRVCVFEDWMSSPGDGWIAKSGLKPHIFGNVVYFALFNSDAEDREKVESTIKHSGDVWLFYGVMSSLGRETGLDPDGGPISRDVVEMLAQWAEKIIVGAYDGESYLIWTRPNV